MEFLALITTSEIMYVMKVSVFLKLSWINKTQNKLFSGVITQGESAKHRIIGFSSI